MCEHSVLLSIVIYLGLLFKSSCTLYIIRSLSFDFALKFHFGTPHMAAFRKALADSPPASMNVKVHELGAQLELPS